MNIMILLKISLLTNNMMPDGECVILSAISIILLCWNQDVLELGSAGE
jgi:hypothetical protein